jgi:formylglycine-generating enzyme required for sulfatase activity
MIGDRLAAGALALGLLAGCSEAESRPEWLVVIATDAPIPQLGDRLLVEILAEDGALACSSCRRVFPVGSPQAWPLSFSVVPPERSAAVLLRGRLHRSDHIGADGAPLGDTLIDQLAVLPPVEERARVGLVLSMACFGVPADEAGGESCDPTTRLLAPATTLSPIADDIQLPRAGSWPLARPAPCASEAPEAMACLPGGLVLLGSPHSTPHSDPLRDPLPERLVRVSPFFLDLDEMTVRDVRALVESGDLSVEPVVRDPDFKSVLGACTYLGASSDDNDAMPVSCVTHTLAEMACEALGKRLPTEAEWEYAASNLGLETPYPWGYDEDVCGRAIVGRGRFGEAYIPEPSSCRGEGSDVLPWGPVAGGSDSDVNSLGLRNLGGNLREWVSDLLAAYVDPCWSGGTPALVDPRCDEGGAPAGWSIRGGGWGSFPFAAHAAERDGGPGISPNIGFRCARSD